jgi:hypothetical protein
MQDQCFTNDLAIHSHIGVNRGKLLIFLSNDLLGLSDKDKPSNRNQYCDQKICHLSTLIKSSYRLKNGPGSDDSGTKNIKRKYRAKKAISSHLFSERSDS